MNEQVLLQTHDALVRVLSLDAGEFGQWHHHSVAAEHIVCLSGELHLLMQGTAPARVLQATEQARIAPGLIHCVGNGLSTPCSFVLVQGPGQYDFILDSVPQKR